MHASPQFSIIVPVYNGAEYLDRCVSSVLRQNYDDFEIVFVDDGSTDDSSALCDRWSKKDRRMRVVHQRNQGLPKAREVGVANAKGAYLIFIDVDDWIADKMLQAVDERIKQTHADVIFCQPIWTADIHRHEAKLSKKAELSKVLLTGEETLSMILRGEIDHALWQLIVNRKLFEQNTIVFPVGISMGEDLGTTYQVLACAGSVSFLDYAYYFYFQHKESMVQAYANPQRLVGALKDVWTVEMDLLGYVAKQCPNLKNLARIHALRMAFMNLCRIALVRHKNEELLTIRDVQEHFYREQCRDKSQFMIKDQIRTILVRTRMVHWYVVGRIFVSISEKPTAIDET